MLVGGREPCLKPLKSSVVDPGLGPEGLFTGALKAKRLNQSAQATSLGGIKRVGFSHWYPGSDVVLDYIDS